ncbi:Uncharacterised protein [Mycobacteroides abscessus subsp. abscessus]|nr:Uncharacterised protein [Mycobacteroides abscessus subsp. abscessus]
MHGHEFDRRDAKLFEVVDDHRVGKAGIGATQLLRDVGMGRGHAFDMRFVDDRLVIGASWRAVVLPVEVRVDDHGQHRVTE